MSGHSPDEHRFLASADITGLHGDRKSSHAKQELNRTRQHDGWELSELTDRRIKIDRPVKNTARGELEAQVAIDPERLQFRFTNRVRHDRASSIAAMY